MQALEYCHLGHILSLWEVLSVETAKRLILASQVRFVISFSVDYTTCIENCFVKFIIARFFAFQEPFESILEEFLKPLATEEVKQLNTFLHSIDIVPFLGILFECIETYIRHLEPNKSDWP